MIIIPTLHKFVMKGIKLTLIINTLLLFAFNCKSNGNSNSNFWDVALFSIGKIPGKTDVLYQYKPSIEQWVKVGDIGTTGIHSIAIDAENFIIYAVDRGTLGTLNPVTAEFTEIGNIGNGNGEYGYANINQVYGLTFNPIQKVLYATNRIDDSADVLVKINPINGKLIKNSFVNLFFQNLDYAIIEAAKDKSVSLKDVSCLLYEPITRQLICIQRGFDKIAMSVINKNTGFLLQVVFDLSSVGILSIDYDLNGNLYATTLNEIDEENGITQIDLGFVNVNLVNPSNIETDLQFTGLAFIQPNAISFNCNHEVNLICASPQLPEIKAKQSIKSNTDIRINTIYKTEGYVSLHNYFSIPANLDFSIEIADICD